MERPRALAAHVGAPRPSPAATPATQYEIKRIDQDDPDVKAQHLALQSYVGGGDWGDFDGPTEWTLGTFAGEQLVSSHCMFPFTMRMNGQPLACAGVATVGTLPEYRRQGFLRAMVSEAFSLMREDGQSVAALWPSQSAIYQRYGYAHACADRSYTVVRALSLPPTAAQAAAMRGVRRAWAAGQRGYRVG